MERDEVERVERELDEILSIVQPDQTARGSDIGLTGEHMQKKKAKPDGRPAEWLDEDYTEGLEPGSRERAEGPLFGSDVEDEGIAADLEALRRISRKNRPPRRARKSVEAGTGDAGETAWEDRGEVEFDGVKVSFGQAEYGGAEPGYDFAGNGYDGVERGYGEAGADSEGMYANEPQAYADAPQVYADESQAYAEDSQAYAEDSQVYAEDSQAYPGEAPAWDEQDNERYDDWNGMQDRDRQYNRQNSGMAGRRSGYEGIKSSLHILKPSDGLLAAFFVPVIVMIIVFAQREFSPSARRVFCGRTCTTSTPRFSPNSSTS